MPVSAPTIVDAAISLLVMTVLQVRAMAYAYACVCAMSNPLYKREKLKCKNDLGKGIAQE